MVTDDIEDEFDVNLDQPMTDLTDEYKKFIYPFIAAHTIRRDFYGLPGPDEPDFDWLEDDQYPGVFTDQDKEYFSAAHEFEGQKKRDVRYRLRQRLAGLFDDSKEFDQVRSEDLESVFDSIGFPSPYFAHNLVLFGVRALRVAVGMEKEFQEGDYEECLELAIRRAESRYINNLDDKVPVPLADDGYVAVSADVDVDVTKEAFDGDRLREKILDGEASQDEFSRYWRLGSRRQLVGAARNRGVSEIEVRDDMGLTSRYDVEELLEETDDADDTELTMREYIERTSN